MELVLKILTSIGKILLIFAIPVGVIALIFGSLCLVWFLILKYKYKYEMPPTGQVPQRREHMIKQIIVSVPRRFMLDKFEREEGYFTPRGIAKISKILPIEVRILSTNSIVAPP